MEFLYNSYVMPELAETTQTFFIALEFLQIGFWNRVMTLQDWCHHYRSFMVVIKNSWIVTVYPSAPWKLIGQRVVVYLSSFVYHGLDFLWATRQMFLEKQRTLTLPLNLFHAHSFNGVWVAHLLLVLWMYDFSYFVYCVCLFSMFSLCPWITFFWLLL